MSEPKRVAIAYRVPYADTDQMRVVYYANYLTLFERARNELMRACGITYRELEAGGFALPVLEAHVRYHAPATYDDLLEVVAWCSEFKGVRLTIRCEIRRDGKLLAEGYTVHAHVDSKTLRPARPARAFLAALGFPPEDRGQRSEVGDRRSEVGV
jgi:acyl-CoA thioester hydrolase